MASPFGRLVCTFGKALRMQECAIVFGIVQLSGKPGGKWKHCKASVQELEAPGGGKVFVFLLVSRECSRGRKRHSHGVVWCLMMDMMSPRLIYTPVIALS